MIANVNVCIFVGSIPSFSHEPTSHTNISRPWPAKCSRPGIETNRVFFFADIYVMYTLCLQCAVLYCKCGCECKCKSKYTCTVFNVA